MSIYKIDGDAIKNTLCNILLTINTHDYEYTSNTTFISGHLWS